MNLISQSLLRILNILRAYTNECNGYKSYYYSCINMSHAKVYHYYLFAQGIQIYLPNQGGQNYHFKLIRGL